VLGVLDGPLEQYRRQFPQWSTHRVAKGTGYTARGGGHRVAGEWQTGFRTCGSCPPLPGR
jgi:hypothetical protein